MNTGKPPVVAAPTDTSVRPQPVDARSSCRARSGGRTEGWNMRKLLLVVALIVGMVMMPSVARVAAAETVTIRRASLAPAGSSWDKVFRAWSNSLKRDTGGAV